MPYINREQQRKFQQEWFQKNKERLIKKQQIDRIKTKQKYTTLLGNECKICGENDIKCLIFHHVNPKEKENTVSFLIRTTCYDKMIKEVKKCMLVCSNCHRIIHRSLIKSPNINTKRKRKYKFELIKLLGSKCCICGECNRCNLVFDNPKISKLIKMNTPLEKLKIEAKSCKLFCSNCYIKIHSKNHETQ